MPNARAQPKTTLVPLETFLVGAWIATTLTAWLARRDVLRTFAADRAAALALDGRLAFRAGVAETLIGAFLVLLALRRRAHGPSLLLPVAAFTVALAFLLYLQPEIGRLLAAGRSAGASTFLRVAYGLELGKVIVLFLAFVTLTREHAVKRR